MTCLSESTKYTRDLSIHDFGCDSIRDLQLVRPDIVVVEIRIINPSLIYDGTWRGHGRIPLVL